MAVCSMIRPASSVKAVYLCRKPVDMRKQMDGLSSIVQHDLGGNPLSGALFVFISTPGFLGLAGC